jgi:hypothetical protein
MAVIFAKALPAMYRFTEKNSPPFIAKVGRDGSVAAWWPERISRKPTCP